MSPIISLETPGADPRYPKSLASGEEAKVPVRHAPGGLRSFNWAALPYTRREVERIAEVYPEARLYLGDEATEERAKSVGRDARVLHFATHGYLDDRTPLDSALVLTIPEELPATGTTACFRSGKSSRACGSTRISWCSRPASPRSGGS